MSDTGHNPGEDYKTLRKLPLRKLWDEEVPCFNALPVVERFAHTGLIRAVGVVVAESGSAEEKAGARAWLVSLLCDPDERIRRYAINALPKLGSGRVEEAAMLQLLDAPGSELEKKYLLQALDKIGGRATLEAPDISRSLPTITRQKIQANVVRQEDAGTVLMEGVLADLRGLRIHLRGRRGLENFVRDEVEANPRTKDKFRVIEVSRGLVALRPQTAFSIGDLFSLRCCSTVGFVVGVVKENACGARVEALAQAVSSTAARRIFRAFHEGAPRYRLEFIETQRVKSLVKEVTARAFALCPEILNDSNQAPWSMDVHSTKVGESVELRPRFSPDPRFVYRLADVPAASHPPLAASLARWAGRSDRPERVWDPFCGSGLELIESALLVRVEALYGTDLSPEAIAIADANVKAARLQGVKCHLSCCDFREYQKRAGIHPGSLTLVISNPPLGRRIRIPNLRGMLEDLFHAAADVLRPGGRLIFTNPLKMECPEPSLKLQSRIMADLGGFDCRLEKYVKIAVDSNVTGIADSG